MLFTKILVPHDFSEQAKHALDAALELARRYLASITILHVHDVVLYTLPEGLMLYPATLMSELDTRVHADLDRVKEHVMARGIANVHAELVQGSPAASIVRYATDGAFDLIVMGTHGRTGIAHALIGSVAERVVRSAPCPVLTIRCPDTKKGEAP